MMNKQVIKIPQREGSNIYRPLFLLLLIGAVALAAEATATTRSKTGLQSIGEIRMDQINHLSPQSSLAAFYISPDGVDANPGTLNHPFATLEKARNAVRELKRIGGLPTGGVTIWLRGGEYQVSSPLVLTPEDSGEEGKPVIIAAYGNEKPVIFGGRRITGLRPMAKGIWQVAIPESKNNQWVFRTLYVNSKRYTLARSPNSGYFKIVGGLPVADSSKSSWNSDNPKPVLFPSPRVMSAWTSLGEINVKVLNRWWTSLFTLKHVDPSTGIVQLGNPARDGVVRPENPANELLLSSIEMPFIVENHPGALDEPGEWQLDRKSGYLRIIPRTGEDLGNAEVFAPVVEHLVVLAGDPIHQQFVEHIEFRGIKFCSTSWTLPTEGEDDIQAAVAVGAMIEATGARNCLFEGCELKQTDSYAIWFRSGCRNCMVRKCHIHDLGAGGVKMGEAEKEDPNIAAGDNCVENCFIHDGGHVHGGAIGVWIGASSDNVVSHNEISDFWYTGISTGWMWSVELNETRNNHITYNHIHHVVQRLNDGGGVYCLGLQPQTVVGNNCIHDVGRDGEHSDARGIYLDEGSSAILVENNVVYDTQGAAMHLQLGTNCNIIINNIFAFTRLLSVEMEIARTNVFINNIVYMDSGKLFARDNWPNYEKVISKNVYWSTGNEPILFAGHTWEEWLKLRQTSISWFEGSAMDEGSVIADPQFKDANLRDFRLKAGAPALALGFRPINFEEIGLTGDKEWRSLPSLFRIEIPLE